MSGGGGKGMLGLAAAAIVIALSACGGHGSGVAPIESALAARNVADLFSPTGLAGVTSPKCAATLGLQGDFACTAVPVYRPCGPASPVESSVPCASKFAPTRVWIQCVPSTGSAFKWACTLVAPPAGTPMFTTPALRAAPKHGVWRCVTVNVAQQNIGPFVLATTDPHGPTEQEGGSMTLAAARALAKRLHVSLTVQCAT